MLILVHYSIFYCILYTYETPTSFDINFLGFPVYRADTKEEYYVDAGTAIFKVTAAVYTGGLSAGGAQALTQLGQLLG